MLKSTIAKLVKNSQRAIWGVLLWIPLMALADNSSGAVLTPPPENSGPVVLTPTPVGGIPNVVTMLTTFAKSFPYLFYMVGGLTYVFGLTIVLKALWTMKKQFEGPSMVAQKDLREPLMHFILGILLLFAPSTMRSLLVTVFGTGSLLSYLPGQPNFPGLPGTTWQLALDVIIAFVQFVGFIAFVRGLLHLHKAVSGQAQQNMFSKGIVHLVGGVLSMNVVGTKDILYSTLGLTS